MTEYLARVVDGELDLRLEAFGATFIVGPKWCGKTTTGEQKAKSVLRIYKNTAPADGLSDRSRERCFALCNSCELSL